MAGTTNPFRIEPAVRQAVPSYPRIIRIMALARKEDILDLERKTNR